MARTTPTTVSKAPPKLPKLSPKPTADQLAKLGDYWFAMRAMRLAAEKNADGVKKLESEAYQLLVKHLKKGEASGVRGQLAFVYAENVPEPTLEDREKFLKHVFAKKQFDLLTNAISSSAVKERWEAGQAVPGVGKFNVVKIRYSKV